MGKSKNTKRRRDRSNAESSLHRFLDPLTAANEDVRAAEEALTQARRRAAIAAHEQHRSYGIPEDHREKLRAERENSLNAGLRSRPAHATINLDDAHGQAPEDQAAAFFNRPGDYYLARFTIREADGIVGPEANAETVLKASEDQLDYLLEVLRQIRGGFGDRCRIELYRTHTVEQAPGRDNAGKPFQPNVTPDGPGHAQRYTIPDGPPLVPGVDVHLDARQRGPEVVGDDGQTDSERNGQVPPWLTGSPPWMQQVAWHTRDLTREELQAQLPGMTRAQAAAELGKRPEDIGGNVYATGDLQAEQIAAELGIPVENLQPLPMSNGGTAYAVKPPERAPEGRHAKPEETQP